MKTSNFSPIKTHKAPFGDAVRLPTCNALNNNGTKYILRVRRLHGSGKWSSGRNLSPPNGAPLFGRAQDVIITHTETGMPARRTRAIFATLQGKYFTWLFFTQKRRAVHKINKVRATQSESKRAACAPVTL
jgi:hypothetical protein